MLLVSSDARLTTEMVPPEGVLLRSSCKSWGNA